VSECVCVCVCECVSVCVLHRPGMRSLAENLVLFQAT
jgi:hypothetical protein